METKEETTTQTLTKVEKEQLAAKYAQLLGISPELVKNLVGHKIRGSATIDGEGGFNFTPSGETGPRAQRVATTRRGSYINRSLTNGQYSMTVKAPLDAIDPAADIVDESLSLLKKLSPHHELEQQGRILYRDDTICLRTDNKTCTICADIRCCVENTVDYTGQIVSQIGRVLSVIAKNKEHIVKMKKQYLKSKQKQND